jgi:lipoyl-dependent peroxiredoxin subunit C
MLTVGDKFPSFDLTSVVSLEKGKEFTQIKNDTYAGKWLVVFSWPMDFTFICPTEIAEFGRKAKDFADRDAQVLGFSTDTHFVHLAWRNNHADLKNLPIPMLADTKHELSTALGILHKTDGVALRATFIVDPQGVIRWASVNDLSVGRNVPEVLRVLDGLQTDELCPCNWQKGEKTLSGGLSMSIEALRERLPAAAKDISLNLGSVLQGGALDDEQRWGVALACAFAARNATLRDAVLAEVTGKLREEAIDDARAAAALMAMNNVYYRFRHLVGRETYSQKPARLRMSRIAQPKTSKVNFELMCLAVSAINACEICIKSHERVVTEGGLTEEHVHDAVRIAATIQAAAVSLELG